MTLRMALAFLVLLALLAVGWSHGLFVKAPAHREVAMAHADDLERRDFGVAPASDLHASEMHAPTPASIPGGRLLTTRELVDLLQDERTPYVVFDVLGADQALPGAVQAAWMALPGSYGDAVQRRLVRVLERVTRGYPDVALVFYCLSPECWKSYNAALRDSRGLFQGALVPGRHRGVDAGRAADRGQRAGGRRTSGGAAGGASASGRGDRDPRRAACAARRPRTGRGAGGRCVVAVVRLPLRVPAVPLSATARAGGTSAPCRNPSSGSRRR